MRKISDNATPDWTIATGLLPTDNCQQDICQTENWIIAKLENRNQATCNRKNWQQYNPKLRQLLPGQ